ncbi:hypothetical protein, partial [Corynebacterium sp.]|uniref:hypothetical protein n=1 Tax=Corynebacterium sp. TaxID=1720 RepID=UPI001DEFBB85
QDDVTGEMPTGEDAHGSDYFTPVFLLPQLCNSTSEPSQSTSPVSTARGPSEHSCREQLDNEVN